MVSNKRVIINQTILPEYRLKLFAALIDKYAPRLEIVAGQEGIGGKIHSAKNIHFNYSSVNNHYLPNYSLWWQTLPWPRVVTASLLITEANTRIISTWCVLIARCILGKKTLLWGHLRGAHDKRLVLRRWFIRLGHGFMAYTESEKQQFEQLFPNLPVWSAKNALYWLRDLPPDFCVDNKPEHFVYVGRLIPEKQPELMIKAFLEARSCGKIPSTTKLVIVGGGTLEASLLQAYAHHASIEFRGECTDVQMLTDIYAQSLVSLSPGAVGLAAVQSFCFGVPMILAQGPLHSPEIEACQEGFNCMFFEANNIQSFADQMAQCVHQRAFWVQRRAVIAQNCRARYSLDAMFASFCQAIEYFSPN